jgi:hypothetical protein
MIETNEERLESKIGATMNTIQERFETMISYVWSETEEIVHSRVKGILASFDQRAMNLR